MGQARHSSRRDFLKGRAAADALLDVAQGQLGQESKAADEAAPHAEGLLVHFGRQAMACQFEIYLNAKQYPHGTEAAIDALDLIDRLEDQMSVYRDESEMSALNRAAGGGPVEVEAGLFGLLELSLETYKITGGAFDITSGPLSKAWGFVRRAGRLPDERELAEALAKVGSQHVALDRQRRTVELRMPEVEMNLNSIGKGYALDRCRELLHQAGIHDFLLHGGQSSVLASGSCRSAPRGWSVGLRHPLRPERRLAEFYLQDQALGTSGSATQFFHHQGERYGHVLDPRTGRPSEGVYSSTVIAPTAAQADALATAFYVLGPHAAREICERDGRLGMVLVCPGERSGTIRIHHHGLADGDWKLGENS